MIDRTQVKAPLGFERTRGEDNQAIGRSHGGRNAKIPTNLDAKPLFPGRYPCLDSTIWLCSSTVRLSMRSANSLEVSVSCVFCSSIRISNPACSTMVR